MVTLQINGSQHSFDGDPNMPLLWYLRDELGVVGTKFGCGMALCGAWPHSALRAWTSFGESIHVRCNRSRDLV